jgi:hypothetical protein
MKFTQIITASHSPNDKTGQTGQVKRTGTSGDVLYETVNNRLFTSNQVMGSYGKSKLAKAGLVESHTFSMPLTSERAV